MSRILHVDPALLIYIDDVVLLVILTVEHCNAISQHVGLIVDCFLPNMSVISADAANPANLGLTSDVPSWITHKAVMCGAVQQWAGHGSRVQAWTGRTGTATGLELLP